MKTKQILITFDHELFLGSNSGTLEKCILLPLKEIISIFSKYNIQIVFFLDTLYYEKARNEKDYIENFNKLKSHLIELLKLGHLIFPHIHSHWDQGIYHKETKTWDLSDTQNYRFFNNSQDSKDRYFEICFKIVEELQQEAEVNYPIDSFRAGGWCIQPFEDYKPYFIKYNIKYDLSVVPMQHYIGQIHEYNFSNIKSSDIYSFENDPNIPNPKARFTEIPVTIFFWKYQLLNKLNKINTYLRDRLKIKHFRYFGDGQIATHKGMKYTPKNLGFLSIENLNWLTILKFIKITKKLDFIHFISHSKTLTPHNLLFLKIYLKIITSKYSIQSKYFEIRNRVN
jgi:hypothetical protein